MNVRLSNDGLLGGFSFTIYPLEGWQRVLDPTIELSEEVLSSKDCDVLCKWFLGQAYCFIKKSSGLQSLNLA